MVEPTEAQIDAAYGILSREWGDPPHLARIRDYVSSTDPYPGRDDDMAAYRAASREAESLNRDLIRRTLRAALSVPADQEVQ